MIKKSTIGMALLVAMVLAKAFLSDFEVSQDELAVRSDSNVDEMVDLRATHESDFLISPRTNLLASTLSIPDISEFKFQEKEKNIQPTYFENHHLAEVINPVNVKKDEIIPMDYVSNTGYGLWNISKEKISTKSDWEGKVPLDNSNTITDNISKLFPRTP